MTCTDHDRTHCPEPRCHVLAVCESSLPSPLESRWVEGHGYADWFPVWADMARQIATRLVAWMRAQRTERKPGPLRIMVEGDIPEGVWAEYGPGHYHSLDAVMSHSDRVAALVSKCPNRWCRNGRHPPKVPFPLPLGPPSAELLDDEPCAHDGINWATVAVLLDGIQELGIGLDVVHEWRPHDDETERHDDDTHWTDQDFQEMAIS